MTNTHLEPCWYIIRTRQHAEQKVSERLLNTGLNVYLPLYETIRIWSDRKKKLKAPLIPRHVFVFCSQTELKLVYDIPGVTDVLREFGKPAVVRPVEIENMRILCGLDEIPDLSEPELFDKGEEIRIVEGPFKGLEGTCMKLAKGCKIQVLLEHLNMAFVLDVKKKDVIRL